MLDGHAALKFRVQCLVYLAHTTAAQRPENLESPKRLSR